MPKKGDRKWHAKLLADPRMVSWYERRSRKSRRCADESLRRIARGTHDALGKTPLDLLGMGQAQLEDAVTACISYHLDEKELLGSTVNSFYNTLLSFLRWHGKDIERENYIPGAEEYPNAEDATIPDQDAMKAVLRIATERTAVMIAVVGQGGQRECVLGNNDGDNGLRLGAFLEMQITENDIVFSAIPTRVEVEKGLSKNRKRFFFFLGPEACQIVRAYLLRRMRNGERLGPESPLIAVAVGTPHFMLTNNIGDAIRRAMRRADLKGYPYLWRSYYANRCQLAESKGFLESWRKFFQGHTGNIQTRYANRKQGLPLDSIEAMRAAFAKALPFIESEKKESRDPRLEMVTYELQAAGMSEEEIGRLDLNSKTADELMQLARQAISRRLGLPDQDEPPKSPSPVRHKVIPLSELDGALLQGWLFKGQLPGDRAVVEASS